MAEFIVKFGIGNSLTKDTANYPTVASVLQDNNLKAALGFGDSVDAFVNGVQAPVDAPTIGGSVISIQTRAHTKGA